MAILKWSQFGLTQSYFELLRTLSGKINLLKSGSWA